MSSRAKSPTPGSLFGPWFPVTLTVVLCITAALASVGLYLKLASSTETVVEAQGAPPPSAASAAGSERPVRDAAPIGAPATSEPSAPTLGAPPGVADPTASPVPVVVAATASPTPPVVREQPSPTPVAVAAPSPEPVARRVPPTPGPRGAPRATANVPIVMYHHIGPLPPNPDVFRRDLTVSPAVFEQTLDYLAEHGIQTVTMADLFEHFAGGKMLPEKSIVLTFDDGYDDNYEHAFRLLKARGMVGTFFITTDFTEHPGYMTWDNLTELHEAGMEIAAHSANHADFTTIGQKELRRQLVEPKEILEKHLGYPVDFLAYPAGKYNPTVMAASRAAGYKAAVTVLHGTRHTPAQAFELRRVRAHGADTVGQIAARFTPAAWR